MEFKDIFNMLVDGTWDTLYMVLISTLLGYVLGLPLGILLTITDADGIRSNKVLYKILDIIINVTRSIPFLILLILIMPFTKAIVGKSYGTTATIVPLTVAAAPLIARMVESSLKEVDKGVIEAAFSMGAGYFTIIWKVLVTEARTSLLVGVTIALGTILGYSAMAGVRRRRTGRHRHPLRILPVRDGNHDCDGCGTGCADADSAVGRNVNIQKD